MIDNYELDELYTMQKIIRTAKDARYYFILFGREGHIEKNYMDESTLIKASDALRSLDVILDSTPNMHTMPNGFGFISDTLIERVMIADTTYRPIFEDGIVSDDELKYVSRIIDGLDKICAASDEVANGKYYSENEFYSTYISPFYYDWWSDTPEALLKVRD